MSDCQCEHIKNVSATIAELFKDNFYLDVSINIDNDVFHSNRLLLAASSDYFRASLNFNLSSENHEYVDVSCEYVSHIGLRHVIEYINSLGRSCHSIPVSDYLEVYTASSFLQVDHLRTLMSQSLENSLCADNVLYYLKLAYLFDDAQLLHKATLVLLNEFHSVDYHSEDFVNLTEDQVEKIFVSDQINVPTEGAMVEALVSWLCGDIDGRMPFFRNNFIRLVRLPLIGAPELRKIVANPRFASAGNALEMLQVAHSILTNPYHGEIGKKHEFLSRLATSTNQCKVRSGTGYRLYSVGGIQQSSDHLSSTLSQNEDGFCVYNHDLSMTTFLMPPNEICRVYHAVAASLNWLYIIGGESEDGQLLNHCSRYSLTEHEWCPMAELAEPRSHHSVSCIENLVYVFGGYSLNWSCGYSPATNSILIYDPLRNTWRKSTQQLPLGLVDMGNVLIPRKHSVMLAGGLEEYGDQMRPTDRVFLYDPTDEVFQNFTELPRLPVPLVSIALAYDELGKRVFACGGRFWRSITTTTNWIRESDDISNKVYSFSFISNSWCFVTILDFPRYAGSAFVHNGNLYLFGGITSDQVIEGSSDLIFSALHNSLDDSDESDSPPVSHRRDTSVIETRRSDPTTLFWEKLSRENTSRPDFLQGSLRTCHFVEAWKLLARNLDDSNQQPSSSSPNLTSLAILRRLKVAHSRREDGEFVLTRCFAAFCMAPYHDLNSFP